LGLPEILVNSLDGSSASIAITQRDVIRFFFKWWRSIAAMTATVLGIVLLMVYLLPQGYTARTQVLIDSIQALATQNNPKTGIDIDAVLNTEIRILMSRPVIEATVEDLGLHLVTPKESGFNGFKRGVMRFVAGLGLVSMVDEKENWVSALTHSVRVKAVPRSSVLEIEYKYKNAAMAADIINSLTENFVQHHVEVYTVNELTDFYAEQAELIEAQLKETGAALQTLRASHGSSSSREANLTMMQNIANLKDQEASVMSELIDLRAQYDPTNERVISAEAKLSMLGSRVAAATAEILELDSRADQIEELESKISTQREAHERVLQLMGDANLTSHATTGTSNVRVIEYATTPVRPDNDRWFYIALSLIAGLGLAVSTAVLREYFDQRVERPDIAERLLGLPVYGAIPAYDVSPDFSRDDLQS
jgi:uncharacterized protein involved in exopolysaccharide biosynthesis